MYKEIQQKKEKDLLRKQIIAAAEELFLSEGLKNVSMRSIAQKIGYSATTIYIYFKNKEELIKELIKSNYDEFVQEIRSKFQPSDNPFENLNKVLNLYVQTAISNPAKYKLVINNYHNFTYPEFSSDKYLGFNYILENIEKCIKKGIFNKIKAKTATQGLWITTYGLLNMLTTSPDSVWWENRDELIGHTIKSALDGLRK